jgi:hypothetical protein
MPGSARDPHQIGGKMLRGWRQLFLSTVASIVGFGLLAHQPHKFIHQPPQPGLYHKLKRTVCDGEAFGPSLR